MTCWPRLSRRSLPCCFGSARVSLSRSVNVGNLNSKGIRRRDLVILFLHPDVPDMFGQGILAQCFALTYTLLIEMDRLVLA